MLIPWLKVNVNKILTEYLIKKRFIFAQLNDMAKSLWTADYYTHVEIFPPNWYH